MQVVEEDEEEEDNDMVEDAAVSLSLIYGVTRPREPGVCIQMYAETTVQPYNLTMIVILRHIFD